jgi:hypothetical protein
MILSDAELRAYRACVGLQVQYAQAGDSHKVVELQQQLEGWIKRCAEKKVAGSTGQRVQLNWSGKALSIYRKLCADAMAKAAEGFHVWAAEQYKIEAWVSDCIQGALFQAAMGAPGDSIIIKQIKK